MAVRASHLVQPAPPSPAYELTSTPTEVEVEQDGTPLRLTSGRLTAEVTVSGPWGLRFLGDGRPLTGSGTRSLGWATDSGSGQPSGDHMVERLSLPGGANVYGFGERFTPLVKNGQVVDTWNQDGGTASEQAYKTVPFFLTDAGYGVFVNSPARVSFEVASEVVSTVQSLVPGHTLEYLVGRGPTTTTPSRPPSRSSISATGSGATPGSSTGRGPSAWWWR